MGRSRVDRGRRASVLLGFALLTPPSSPLPHLSPPPTLLSTTSLRLPPSPSRITIRYSNKADNLKARKQYLITAAREVGVVAEAQPAFAVVMNSMEMTLDLGRMARRSETMPRYVHVYEYVPSSGWRLLGRVSLKVPCN